jgi:hypothetical protein
VKTSVNAAVVSDLLERALYAFELSFGDGFSVERYTTLACLVRNEAI